MAEPLISAINEIISITEQYMHQEVKLEEQLFQKLTSNLHAVQPVLEDAERRQLKEADVREWLYRLKSVCYELDDALDEFSSAILGLQTDDMPQLPKRVCFFSFSFSEFSITVKEASEKLDVIVKEKDLLGFKLICNVVEPDKKPVSASYIDISSIVCGREREKKELVSLLLDKRNQDQGNFSVISIIGIRGIGKTTLAKMVYEDDKIKSQFKRIWVTISDPFQRTRLEVKIRNDIREGSVEFLLEPMERIVKGKKFLLVLDDVRTDDFRQWDLLRRSLECGAPGSRILVTSVDDNVAKLLGTTHLFRLGELSQEDCWSLFSQVAFYGREREEWEKLSKISNKLAAKCWGMPLAAKILGGLMQFKRSRDEWLDVFTSELWGWELDHEVGAGLCAPFLLSYFDLPAAIRQCLLYCAMFPNNYMMFKSQIISMWMAEGYIRDMPSEEMELVGEEYFQNLAVRSFFQDFEFRPTDEPVLTFKMNHIVREFVRFLAQNECLFLNIDDSKEAMVEYGKVLHSSVMLAEEDQFPATIYDAKNLHSLAIISTHYCPGAAVLSDIFHHLTCLRSLDLSGLMFEELPSKVEKLVHLRYLDLSQNMGLMTLPETLCNLSNLLYLSVEGCEYLGKLPQGMGRLAKLKHLRLFDTYFSHMPKGIEQLTSLQTLVYFHLCVVENESDAASLGELANLNHIGGILSLINLGCVRDVGEAVTADLNKKKNLHNLRLDFTAGGAQLPMNEHDEAVIEALQPPAELKNLQIYKYRGTVLPSWFISLTKLREVALDSCRNIEQLPPLGKLPCLEELKMTGSVCLKTLDFTFPGLEIVCKDGYINTSKKAKVGISVAFPKLKKLTIASMEGLEDWSGIRGRGDELDMPIVMPQLGCLSILDCPRLKALPDYVLTAPLEELTITACPILEEHYRQGTGEDWNKISHVSKRKIN